MNTIASDDVNQPSLVDSDTSTKPLRIQDYGIHVDSGMSTVVSFSSPDSVCSAYLYPSKKSHDIIQEKSVFYGFYCHNILVFRHQHYSVRSGNIVYIRVIKFKLI